MVQLVKFKCFPVLFYGVEACSLRKYIDISLLKMSLKHI